MATDQFLANEDVGGSPILVDDITTLNGGAITSAKAQRGKVVYGSDGSAQDVDATHGLPVDLVALSGVLQTVTTIGTAAAKIVTSPLASRKTVVLQADPANSAVLYIGSSTVTADTGAAGGLYLAAGDSLTLDLGAVDLYARSTASSQLLRVLEVA